MWTTICCDCVFAHLKKKTPQLSRKYLAIFLQDIEK